jgi:hypothetical protein
VRKVGSCDVWAVADEADPASVLLLQQVFLVAGEVIFDPLLQLSGIATRIRFSLDFGAIGLVYIVLYTLTQPCFDF